MKEATVDDSVDVLLDMGALDVKEYLAASQPEVLIVTEDSIIRPLELLVDANNVKNKKVAIKSYFGVKAVDNTRSLIQAIRAFSNAKIVVHRDRDYLADADVETWKKAIREAGATPFVTSGADVEAYFSAIEHLAHVNPHIGPLELEALRAGALHHKTPAMKEKAINWRFDFAKKAKGINVNVGKIAAEVEQIFAMDEKAWLHGKEMVAGLRDGAAKIPGGVDVFEPSPHLTDLELRSALSAA
ncbi:hypothetical protein [uncultured Devosia sp.]|uniref:hypothetical protein n=1 Tax=uncultured Devosia sp. TaxID=211434 RepID=UPI0035CAAA8C